MNNEAAEFNPFTTNLYFEKRNKTSEIIAVLYEFCNFKCTFCPQNHDATIGMSFAEIESKAYKTAEFINNNKFANEFVIRVVGGELFNDEVIKSNDWMFAAYTNFAKIIREETKESGKLLEFVWISNFSMVECRDQVIEFMNSQEKTSFVVSYDVKGRFNKKDLETFKENIEIFADYIQNINTVMTKQNIEAVLAGDKYYKYLYSRFACSWDPYVKADNLNNYASAKESVTLEFYKLLVDEYPEVNFIKPFLTDPSHGDYNTALCGRGNSLCLADTGEVAADGCFGAHYLKKNDVETFVKSNRNFLDSSIEDFLEKYNCHSCEFYKRCPLVCFSGVKAGNMINDMDTCINKLTFQYADSKKSK